jgi:tellurite resistance protein
MIRVVSRTDEPQITNEREAFSAIDMLTAAVLTATRQGIFSATERAMLKEAADLLSMTAGHFVERNNLADAFGRVRRPTPSP